MDLYPTDEDMRQLLHREEQSSPVTELDPNEVEQALAGLNPSFVTPHSEAVPNIYKNVQSLPTQSVPVKPLPPVTGVHQSSQAPICLANYKKVRGKSSQDCRKFPDILRENHGIEFKQNSGNDQLWYFLLQLLNDPKMKSVIVWTGDQRKFRVRDTAMLCRLWSRHNGKTSDVKWESLCRIMRNTGDKLILMAVPSKTHRGRNEEGVFGYVVEPAFYLNMNREALDQRIRLHCETGPLTVGTPIDSSWGYPEGTRLQVFPFVKLDDEGKPISPFPEQFIDVLPAPQHYNSIPSYGPNTLHNQEYNPFFNHYYPPTEQVLPHFYGYPAVPNVRYNPY